MGADKQFESLAQLKNTYKPIQIGLFKIYRKLNKLAYLAH